MDTGKKVSDGKHIFDAIIPVCAAASFIGGFESIKFYKYVLPIVFIPTALATLFFANRITERIPQPPIEKKQEIPFWYGVKEVLHNKYLWINTLTGLIDSMGNGMLDIVTLIFLYTLRLDGLEYGLITTLYSIRGTIPTFFAPLIIDLIGYIFMIIPPLFWDYNIDQHEYVMKVLIQRAKLAEEGYIPSTYEGGLDFAEPGELKDGIPVNAGKILKQLEAEYETAPATE